MIFTCKNCEHQFELPSGDKRIVFCSPECYKEYWTYKPKSKESRACKECGKTFITAIPNKRFCSTTCKREYEQGRWFDTHRKYKKKCPKCFKWFETTDSRQKYCRKVCYDNAKRERNKIRYWKRMKEGYNAEIPGPFLEQSDSS